MHAEYQGRGVALVAISPNDPLAVRLDELGYTDLGDLLTGSVAKNVARLTDRTNETKQTPPTVPPSDYAAELLGEQKIMGLTPVQLAAIAALGLVGIYLVVRR